MKALMRIFDVSVPIRPGMITYPGDPTVRLERVSAIADGALANVSRLEFGVHTGTHVDAPLHFLEDAAATEALPLDSLVGRVHVIAAEELTASELRTLDLPERIVFKTSNSELWARSEFSHDFLSLDSAAAQVLLDNGVRLVAIDYLSIGDEHAHRALLAAGVVVIEGLDLRGVEPGEYELVCAPLKLVGSDGAPARVLLIQNEGARDG
jgi:arylformamidase